MVIKLPGQLHCQLRISSIVLLEGRETDRVLLDIELELSYHGVVLLFLSFDLLSLITDELLI